MAKTTTPLTDVLTAAAENDYGTGPLVPVDLAEGAEPATTTPAELGALAVQFGSTNEFSQRRHAQLQEDSGELIREVSEIDAQLAHLNARRTDAMLAYSGISADLAALERGIG